MAFADFADCIEQVSVDLVVTRFGAITRVKGRATAQAETTFKLRGSLQPMKQRELQLMPEGERNRGVSVLYTTTELFSVNIPGERNPDRVLYKGITYQVKTVDDWADLGNYFRIILVRVNR